MSTGLWVIQEVLRSAEKEINFSEKTACGTNSLRSYGFIVSLMPFYVLNIIWIVFTVLPKFLRSTLDGQSSVSKSCFRSISRVDSNICWLLWMIQYVNVMFVLHKLLKREQVDFAIIFQLLELTSHSTIDIVTHTRAHQIPDGGKNSRKSISNV